MSNKDGDIYKIIKYLIGTSSSLCSSGCSSALLDQSTNSFSSMGGPEAVSTTADGTSILTPEGAGSSEISTGLMGLSSISGTCNTSSGAPMIVVDAGGEIFNVFTENKITSNIVEDRATKVYDALDKKHVPSVKGGATLIAATPETKKLVEEIIGNMTPEALNEALTVFETMLNDQLEAAKVLKKKYDASKR